MSPPGQALIELRAGALRLVLRPDLGACITGFWHGDVPVLRSTDAPMALATPRPSGGFALAPYSNRVGFGRLPWQGQVHPLALNSPGQPHAMHGLGWMRPWQVQQSSGEAAVLRLQHTPDAHWPFALALSQSLRLTPSGLHLHLSIASQDHRDQPAGLGWHPFFAKRPGSHLRVAVSHRWANDPDTGLPTQRERYAAIDAAVSALRLDHGFEGWPGHALLSDAQLVMRLTSNLPRLVVFTPADQPHWCVEPVSHVSNAVQMADPLAHGLICLPPGGTMAADFHLEVHPA